MTTAMAAIKQSDGFWWEARRFCDERDLSDDKVEQIAHALRHEAFMTAIQPFLKIKTDMMMIKGPKMTLYPDGRFESVYEWTEEENKVLAQVDELIADAAKRHGLAPQEIDDQPRP
jgi:hypothetical protein